MWIALAFLFSAADVEQRLDVAIDETLVIEVGYLRGVICDDLSILTAEMQTKDETTNVFVVKGIAEGTTLCKVGTEASRPGILFEVHVVPKRKR